jgi:hypothetical protein
VWGGWLVDRLARGWGYVLDRMLAHVLAEKLAEVLAQLWGEE